MASPLLAFAPTSAFADALVGQTEQQQTNWLAIAMFSLFVLATLGITRWAAKRIRTTSDFYTAGAA